MPVLLLWWMECSFSFICSFSFFCASALLSLFCSLSFLVKYLCENSASIVWFNFLLSSCYGHANVCISKFLMLQLYLDLLLVIHTWSMRCYLYNQSRIIIWRKSNPQFVGCMQGVKVFTLYLCTMVNVLIYIFTNSFVY